MGGPSGFYVMYIHASLPLCDYYLINRMEPLATPSKTLRADSTLKNITTYNQK